MSEACILIVEDATIVARSVERTLERLGYQVSDTVASGEEAVERTLETSPDLVLMDINLAGEMDGIQAAGQIQTKMHVPVVYLTAYADDDTLQRAQVTGPFGYVLKPFGERELHIAIEMALYRHEMERRVSESEERYRAISELTSDFAFSIAIEPDGSIQPEWVTDAFVRLAGVSLEYVGGLSNWQDVVHHNDLAVAATAFETLLSGQEAEAEIRVTMREDEVVVLHTYARPVWDQEQGRVVRIVGAGRDITERRRVEEALRRRDDILEAVRYGASQFLRGGEWEASVQEILERLGSAADASRAYVFENLLGEDGELLMRQRFEWAAPGIAPQIDVQEFQALPYRGGFELWIETVGQGEVLCSHTRDLPPPVGEIFAEQDILSIATVPVFVGSDWWGFVGFDECTEERDWSSAELDALRAATETLGAAIQRQRAERALRESEERFRMLFEQAPLGYQSLDDEGRLVEVNEAWLEMLGYAREGVLGKRFSALLTPADGFRFEERFPRFKAAGATYGTEFSMVRRDGEQVDVSIDGRIGYDLDGRFAQAICILTDITERKRAEEELQRYARELARSNAELEQFAYVASHDLREPLRTVSSYLELLDERYGNSLDKDGAEFVAYALDGAVRMQELIDALLEYARVSTTGSEFEVVDCQTVLEQSLRDLQSVIKESRAKVSSEPLPQVMGDEVQLGQLLQNLIGNGIKFRAKARPKIHIGARQEGEERVFSVRDNGIGLDPQYAERIFEVFQRLHTRDEYPGTGIGLAICKRIVERHGGQIWAESQPGEGATFHFTLPVAHTV
jgi:PAS domain S-box-containing protein